MSVHGGPADWWTEGTDAGRKHVATKGIVQSGLVLNLDAGVSDSYPGSGTTWSDLSGNANNGTLTNGPTYNSANGGSIVFDGVDDYGNFGTVFGNGFGSITVTSWIKPTTFPTTNFVFEKIVTACDNSSSGLESVFSLEIAHNNNAAQLPTIFRGNSIYFGVRSASQSSKNVPIALPDFSSTAIIPYITGCALAVNPLEYSLNTWMHLCGTYNGSETILYINSIQKGTSALQPDGANRSVSGVLNSSNIQRTIASSSDSGSRYTGNISQVSIYNRALTVQEIRQNFNATRGRYGI